MKSFMHLLLIKLPFELPLMDPSYIRTGDRYGEDARQAMVAGKIHLPKDLTPFHIRQFGDDGYRTAAYCDAPYELVIWAEGKHGSLPLPLQDRYIRTTKTVERTPVEAQQRHDEEVERHRERVKEAQDDLNEAILSPVETQITINDYERVAPDDLRYDQAEIGFSPENYVGAIKWTNTPGNSPLKSK